MIGVAPLSRLTSATDIVGQNANARKCTTVAAVIEPQNQAENERLKSSLAAPPTCIATLARV